MKHVKVENFRPENGNVVSRAEHEHWIVHWRQNGEPIKKNGFLEVGIALQIKLED